MIPSAFRQKGGGSLLGVRPHSRLPGPFGRAAEQEHDEARRPEPVPPTEAAERGDRAAGVRCGRGES